MSRIVIQVAGTKGKGSTSAYLANILTAAGYKTGLFVSPHIRVPNERVSIDGKNIPDADLDRLMEQTTETGYFRKFFQVSQAWFAEQAVQAAVMETGLGGRLDPATALPACQVILTRIGMDHMDILGHTLPLIALEKAAAIRKEGSTICAPQAAGAAAVVRAACYMKHSRLLEVQECDITDAGDSFSAYGVEGLRIANDTRIQRINAATAVRAAIDLRSRHGMAISDDAIRAGLAGTELLGRQQYLPEADALIDGAHNVDSLQFLHETLKTEYADRKKVLVCASMRDKDVSYFGEMAGEFAVVYASQMEYDRCMTAAEMAENFPAGTKLVLCSGTADALAKIAEDPDAAGALKVFAGSIYQAGEALDLLDAAQA